MKKRNTILIFFVATVLMSLLGCNRQSINTNGLSTSTIDKDAEQPITENMQPICPPQQSAFFGASQEDVTSNDTTTIQGIVEEFTRAFFAGDFKTMSNYLDSQKEWDRNDVYTMGGTVSDISIKGLEKITLNGDAGTKTIWVEFKTTVFPDKYLYLTISLIKSDGNWKITFYGIEP